MTKLLTTTATAPTLDQFYTRPETAALCLDHLRTVLPDLSADLYLEPSAGDGAFYDLLPEPRIGIDIAPGSSGISTADFLEFNPPKGAGKVVTIGNPPFGRNASQAIAFLNRAAQFSSVVAMILPASMMKPSMQRRIDPHLHLVSELPLLDELFHVGRLFRKVDTVFQVWRREETPRVEPVQARTHADFTFVKDLAEADFAMRRVGGLAGKILPIPDGGAPVRGYSPSSNYYLAANGIDPSRLEARFRALDFTECARRTAAHPSISKSEIVALYEAQVSFETVVKTPEGGEAPKASVLEVLS